MSGYEAEIAEIRAAAGGARSAGEQALAVEVRSDDAVFFGSPGIGTRDVGNLLIPEGHAYNIEGRSDPVADMGQFGPDPSGMPGMNQLSAREETGAFGPMAESAWHSYYLDDNSTSQYNMATVLTGMSDEAIHDQ